MTARSRFSHLFISSILFLFTTSCNQQATANLSAPVSSYKEFIEDRPLALFQNELLDLAFETATAIPVEPHIKDRSRAQEKAVAAALELDQPQKALEYIEKIENWRKGAGYADLAIYCVRHGYPDEVQKYLDLAENIADATEDWRKDTIRVKIAQTHTLLGQTALADKFSADVVDSESGIVAGTRAMMAEDDAFDENMKNLDTLIVSANFDTLKNALESSTELFNRFYDDPDRRRQVEERIKSSWVQVPVFVKIELLMKLAKFSLDHADKEKALILVNEAQTIMESAIWPFEYQIPLVARLSNLRFQAGDEEKARADVEAQLALYDLEGDKIVNIYRAEALRPAAETYQKMGDPASALAVYKKAVEEGIINPNSRPRAEDLSATLISMALHGVEPDAQLWTRIRQIKAGLADPW